MLYPQQRASELDDCQRKLLGIVLIYVPSKEPFNLPSNLLCGQRMFIFLIKYNRKCVAKSNICTFAN